MVPAVPVPLALETKQRWAIPNELRKEKVPILLQAALELIESTHPHLRATTISNTYNCVGMVLASRRTWVDTLVIERIFRDDGFRELGGIAETELGDVVTYHDENGWIQHVGIIARKEIVTSHRDNPLKVLSKWGEAGEYVHDLNDVPEVYGRIQRFWTHRSRL